MEYHQLQAQQDFFIYVPDVDEGTSLGTEGAGGKGGVQQGAAKSGPLLLTDDNWVEIPLTGRLIAYARVWGQRKPEDACC